MMMWAEHVACMGDMITGPYKIF